MKLATYKDGSRDGQLVVVSRDLSQAHYANGIATRLQQVLDDWNFLSPQLEELYTTLNHGRARHAFAFDPKLCMAPLPRAYQWLAGSAYLSHQERLHQARGAELARLGARIRLDGDLAIVEGIPVLKGAPVMATDLRASVSLVIAALAAEGETVVHRVYHLDRGFEALEKKLERCGAEIERLSGER